MIGVLIDLTDEQAEELEATELDVRIETDVPGGYDNHLVGMTIAHGIEDESGGIIDINGEMLKATILLNRYGVDGDIQLFYGNEQC
jgi:hypothetical protein